MEGKLIVEVANPQTQDIDSGKALAKFLGLKEELPEIIPLANGAQLTLSSKKDAYYYTSLNACSCKAGEHHKICYHRRDMCQAVREASKRSASSKVEEAKLQARQYQAKQRMLRNAIKLSNGLLEPMSSLLDTKVPFKPCLE